MGVKFVFTADFHLHNNDRFGVVDAEGRTYGLKQKLKALEQIDEFAYSQGAHLIIGGDITEQKDRIPSVILNTFYDWLRNRKTEKVIIYTGNHDSAVKSQPAICVVRNFEGVTFIDQCRMILVDPDGTFRFCTPSELEKRAVKIGSKILGIIPHQTKQELISEQLKQWEHVDILLMHQAVESASVGNYQLPTGVKTGVFSQIPIVFSGDIHKGQSIGNLHYVGSPYQTNFGEEDYACRIIEFDCDSPSTFQSVPISGPKYVTIKLTVDEAGETFIAPEDTDKLESICYLKLKICCSPHQHQLVDQQKIRDYFLGSFDIVGVVFEFEFEKQVKEVTISEVTSPEEAIGVYVKELSSAELGGLNVEVVMETGGRLVRGETDEKENERV